MVVMPETIDDIPYANQKYPWEEWTDGTLHIVDPKDYDVAFESFRSYLHQQADLRGLRVKTRRTEDWKVAFQYFVKSPA